MMYLFQLEETAIKVVDKAFTISPDTVFGALVGLLVLGIVGLAYWIKKQGDQIGELNKKVISLTESAITVITNNSNVLESLSEAIHDLRSATPAQIKDTEERIKEAIQHSHGNLKVVLENIRK